MTIGAHDGDVIQKRRHSDVDIEFLGNRIECVASTEAEQQRAERVTLSYTRATFSTRSTERGIEANCGIVGPVEVMQQTRTGHRDTGANVGATYRIEGVGAIEA